METIKKNIPLIIIGTVSFAIAGFIVYSSIKPKSPAKEEKPESENPFIDQIDQKTD
jgi:hypothetical protein